MVEEKEHPLIVRWKIWLRNDTSHINCVAELQPIRIRPYFGDWQNCASRRVTLSEHWSRFCTALLLPCLGRHVGWFMAGFVRCATDMGSCYQRALVVCPEVACRRRRFRGVAGRWRKSRAFYDACPVSSQISIRKATVLPHSFTQTPLNDETDVDRATFYGAQTLAQLVQGSADAMQPVIQRLIYSFNIGDYGELTTEHPMASFGKECEGNMLIPPSSRALNGRELGIMAMRFLLVCDSCAGQPGCLPGNAHRRASARPVWYDGRAGRLQGTRRVAYPQAKVGARVDPTQQGGLQSTYYSSLVHVAYARKSHSLPCTNGAAWHSSNASSTAACRRGSVDFLFIWRKQPRLCARWSMRLTSRPFWIAGEDL